MLVLESVTYVKLKEQYHVNLQKDECHTDSQGKSLLDFFNFKCTIWEVLMMEQKAILLGHKYFDVKA